MRKRDGCPYLDCRSAGIFSYTVDVIIFLMGYTSICIYSDLYCSTFIDLFVYRGGVKQ